MITMDEMVRAGCTTHRGVRHWESLGLLGPVARNAADVRQFTDEQLDRAKIIAAAQFGGFDLETVGKMLEDYDSEAFDALAIRLADQMRAAARLAENLPRPKTPTVEFDL